MLQELLEGKDVRDFLLGEEGYDKFPDTILKYAVINDTEPIIDTFWDKEADAIRRAEDIDEGSSDTFS